MALGRDEGEWRRWSGLVLEQRRETHHHQGWSQGLSDEQRLSRVRGTGLGGPGLLFLM